MPLSLLLTCVSLDDIFLLPNCFEHNDWSTVQSPHIADESRQSDLSSDSKAFLEKALGCHVYPWLRLQLLTASITAVGRVSNRGVSQKCLYLTNPHNTWPFAMSQCEWYSSHHPWYARIRNDGDVAWTTLVERKYKFVWSWLLISEYKWDKERVPFPRKC